MDWSDVIRRFKDLRSLIDAKPVFRWGIITNADPLLVQLDGDDRPLAGSPSTIIGGLSAGKRVLCMVQNRRVTVIGRGGADVQGDTSWSMLSGWTGGFAHSVAPVYYRVRAGYVEFKGSLTNSGWSGAYTSFGATMPSYARPTQTMQFQMPANSTVVRTVEFSPSGQIRLYGSVNSGAWWTFDQVRFPLD